MASSLSRDEDIRREGPVSAPLPARKALCNAVFRHLVSLLVLLRFPSLPSLSRLKSQLLEPPGRVRAAVLDKGR
jgi:hypothetical protein